MNNVTGTRIELRQVYAKTMLELMQQNDSIVLLHADLMYAQGLQSLQASFPDRVINVGVAEANMIGIAAGLSAMGHIPIVHSFASFASRRCYDQAFVSSHYGKNPIIVIGSDPGLYATYNGATHMCLEDIALMRVIPDSIVLEASDCYVLQNLLRECLDTRKTCYIRMPRRETRTLYDASVSSPIGKSICIQKGKDVCFLAVGTLSLIACIEAAELLLEKDITASIYDMYSIKPIDTTLLLHVAQTHECLVTCENHQVVGGLGGAVVEFICETHPKRVIRCGVQEQFGEVGDLNYLVKRFNLTKNAIAERIIQTLRRKG